MYAIIETGGKQYRVQKGDKIHIELTPSESANQISFDQVLLLSHDNQIRVGTPHLSGCKVVGEIQGKTKGEKVIAYKYKKRKNYRRKVGHRQQYLTVAITDIKLS